MEKANCWLCVSHSVVSDSSRPHGLGARRPPGSSVHEILQARILEWAVIPFSRGSSWPRDRTQVSGTAGGFFIVWATGKPSHLGNTYPNKNELLLHSHCVCAWLLSVMCDTLWPHRLAYQALCPWDSPGKKSGMGCHFFLQRIFLTQGSNPSLLCFLQWQADSLPLAPPKKSNNKCWWWCGESRTLVRWQWECKVVWVH